MSQSTAEDAQRTRQRQSLDAAETAFEDAFEALMQHTDLRRCMDALGRVLEDCADSCGRNKTSATLWRDRAAMLFDLGEQFQGMD